MVVLNTSLRILTLLLLFTYFHKVATDDVCNYQCSTCSSKSTYDCTDCSDDTRGYNGIPGYDNTCYCLSDYSESYKKTCDDYSISHRAAGVLVSIGLWLVALLSIVVSIFGNQFMGFYCIEQIQVMAYQYFNSEMFPSQIHDTLFYSRYISVGNFKSMLRNEYLTKIKFTSGAIGELVIVPNQQTDIPKFTYIELPSNFIYNSLSILIVMFILYSIILAGMRLKKYNNFKFFAYIYQTLSVRTFQFFLGDLLFFSFLQCVNVDFSSGLGSFGLILCIVAIAGSWAGVSIIIFIVNMKKVKFELDANAVFFNKLKNNDKINRNFLLIQLFNKILIVLFVVALQSNSQSQILTTSIIQFAFCFFTFYFIRLKKKRYQYYLVLVNILRMLLHIFLILFSFSNDKIIIAWIFAMFYIFYLSLMLMYLIAETTSLFPDIVFFFKTRNLNKLFNPSQLGAENSQQLEMQTVDQNLFLKFHQNPIYNIFESEKQYSDTIQQHLAKYKFDLPEEPKEGEQQAENSTNQSNGQKLEEEEILPPQLEQIQEEHQNQEQEEDDFDPEGCLNNSDD